MNATAQDTLVVLREGSGFRVYHPAEPSNVAMVSGTAQKPVCTCWDYQKGVETNPAYHCRHIAAVLSQLPPSHNGPTAEEEREAIRNEGNPFDPVSPPPSMTFKRSVSPDGRIDSLSVEVTVPMPGAPDQVKLSAFRVMGMQDEITEAFLRVHRPGQGSPSPAQSPPPQNGAGNGHGNGNQANGNGHPPQNGHTAQPAASGPVHATIVNIDGMNTRNGWSFFLNIDADGQRIRLFGRKNELGQAITDAGYPHLSGNIQKGVQLNVPCQVILTQNGRYQKVERVMPATGGQPAGQPAAQAGGYASRNGGYGS